MVDLSATNVVVDSQSARRAMQWRERLLATLNKAAEDFGESTSGEHSYTIIASEHLVGILLVVLVKNRTLRAVSEVQTAQASCGIMGMMGNKGAVAVRCKLFDTSVCFVCSHLAAHRANVEGRNGDYHTICSKLRFIGTPTNPSVAALPSSGAAAQGGPSGPALQDGSAGVSGSTAAWASDVLEPRSIHSHDVVVWCGDLNYRIREDLSIDEVLHLATDRESPDALATLLSHDQLAHERKCRRVFEEYKEAQILFPPTYKYQPGTSSYETRPDKKRRAPAWCDRVMWRTQLDSAGSIRALYYSATDLVTSDHKPVHALFALAAKSIIPAARAAVLTEILAALDASENAALPCVEITPQAVDLGTCVLASPRTAVIIVKNTGSSSAQWSFVPPPDKVDVMPPWASVTPDCGIILPGQDAEITVTATYTVGLARDLSAGAIRELDAVLIFKLEHGRDFFISLAGQLMPTAFGASIEQLIRRPEPVRTLAPAVLASAASLDDAGYSVLPRAAGSQAEPAGEADLLGLFAGETAGSTVLTAAEKRQVGLARSGLGAPMPSVPSSAAIGPSGTEAASPVLPSGSAAPAEPPAVLPRSVASKPSYVPKEQWRLIDALLARDGLKKRGVFVAVGDSAEMHRIREAVDTGAAVPSEVSALSIAQTLLFFFAALRDPVIPPPLFPGEGFRPAHLPAYIRMLMSSLSPARFNALVYLLAVGRATLQPENVAHNGATAHQLAAVFSRACMRKVCYRPGIGSVEPAAPTPQAHSRAVSSGSVVGRGTPDDDAFQASLDLLDPDSSWQPSPSEQENMTRIFLWLLTQAVSF